MQKLLKNSSYLLIVNQGASRPVFVATFGVGVRWQFTFHDALSFQLFFDNLGVLSITVSHFSSFNFCAAKEKESTVSYLDT